MNLLLGTWLVLAFVTILVTTLGSQLLDYLHRVRDWQKASTMIEIALISIPLEIFIIATVILTTSIIVKVIVKAMQ